MSLWWHSAPDICLALNNTLDRAGEWWPPGRLTLQPVPRWATSGQFLPRSLPLSLCLPLHLSFSVSFLSIHIHLSDGSFWGAYSWHAGVFISTSNPFRVGLGDQSCHWQAAQASAPQQPSIHSSSWLYVITKEERREASVQSKNLGWLHFSDIARHVIYLYVPKAWCLGTVIIQQLEGTIYGFDTVIKDMFVICFAFLPSYVWFINPVATYFFTQRDVQTNVEMLHCRNIKGFLMSDTQNWIGVTSYTHGPESSPSKAKKKKNRSQTMNLPADGFLSKYHSGKRKKTETICAYDDICVKAGAIFLVTRNEQKWLIFNCSGKFCMAWTLSPTCSIL